jgi:hypothetical protein
LNILAEYSASLFRAPILCSLSISAPSIADERYLIDLPYI